MSKEDHADHHIRAYPPGDLIADGVVTELQAEMLFNDYARRLDHYLYRILGASATLDGIRASSPALLAAVCTVAALHSEDLAALYEPCYRCFAAMAANLALAENANMDDIRSLCIGAFWLHRLSWNLSALAVRIATQKHLHRAFRAAVAKKDSFHFAQTRLYFLVYVCDHHFSIAYGRPPLTQDSEDIIRARDFLLLPAATEDDARLVSQVELWCITSRVLGAFGFDVEVSLSPSLLSLMRRFAIDYDTWRADWNDRFGRHVRVGNYPRKGVKLHVNFAKLYLCSHAFRGLAPGLRPAFRDESPGDGPPSGLLRTGSVHTHTSPMQECRVAAATDEANDGILDSADLGDMALTAVQAAQDILDTMVSDAEIQEHIHGLPVYFHTMIAFATIFLFKVATKYAHVVKIDVARALALLVDVSRILKTMTATMATHHLLERVQRKLRPLWILETVLLRRDDYRLG
ncbi:Transcription factor [Niveomyces insectorum RCEF 264]|uniref:Transcription factor n=1 Tax=Niveomyces insectorum RCEF 264 TaxID=1081102 RepID=A0A167YN22_9HYPO|nr:Transcription factor [Niveomyces insectorum RCEF 264]